MTALRRVWVIAAIAIAVLAIWTPSTLAPANAGYPLHYKLHVINHEIMHAIGPGHWETCPSVIGVGCPLPYAYRPSEADHNRVHDWYYQDRPAGGVYWRTGTVCVEDHSYGNWPVRESVKRMTELPFIRLVYMRSSCLEAGYKQVIQVYEKDWAEGMCRAGGTLVWHSSTYEIDWAQVNLYNRCTDR